MERADEPSLGDLAALRQWIAELEIPTSARQRAERALQEAEERLKQEISWRKQVEAELITQRQLLAGFDDQRRFATRQAVLYRVLHAVAGQTDPDYVARSAVEAITKATSWPNVVVAVADEDQTHWVVRAASGTLSSAVGRRFATERGVVGRAFRTAQSQLVPDVRADPDYIEGSAAIGSELAIPLRRGGRTLGVLNVESAQLAAFDEDDVLLVESLADAVALALDNAQLYSQLTQNAANLSALYTVTRMASQSLVLEDVISQALSSALALLGFKAGLIALSDPRDERLNLVAEQGLPSALAEYLRCNGVDETLATFFQTHHVEPGVGDLVLEGVSEASGEGAQLIAAVAAQGFRAYASIPLLHRGELLGAMILFSHRTRLSVTDELALLTSMGHQVATAAANARLFQTIASQRSRLQALIESSRDGIILSGMDQRLLLINAPALKLLGLSGQPDDWVERPLRDALTALQQHAPAVMRTFMIETARIVHGDAAAGEGEVEVPPRRLHWSNLPVLSGDALQGRLIVLRDVTEERLLEQMREDLTHTMVHDLRNPLTAILAALDLLGTRDTENLSARQVEFVNTATSAAERMLELVNNILDVSRLESGRMLLHRTAVSLSDLVTEVLRTQAPLATDRKLRLESAVLPLLPAAWADDGLTKRVLQNLVDNAIKFTPPGGLISISARRCAESGELQEQDTGSEPTHLCVAVADSGPGIPIDLQNRLFHKFVTGRHAASGSGLGLAFCKLAVEAQGGSIWFESEPGQGSTFIFTLPAARL